jgi:hypothetical protein
MIYRVIRSLTAVSLFICISISAFSQDPPIKNKTVTEKTEPRPFKILTNGKHITVQSNKDLQKVMVWSSNGNRIVEQQEVNANSYSFTTPSSDKIYFLMVQMKDGKVFTEKIGIR